MLVAPSWDSNIRFVYFGAKGARARVHFPSTYFLYFVRARFVQTPSLFFFFVNIMKEKSSKRKNLQLLESISMFTSIYRLISSNNC